MITLKQLPTSVKLFVERCDAFIVGSAANPNAVIQDVADIDVVIPFHKCDVACIIIQSAVKDGDGDEQPSAYGPALNVYGGLKFIESIPIGSDWQNISIDVWPSDLNKFLLSSLVEYIWNPKFNLRYVRCATGDKT